MNNSGKWKSLPFAATNAIYLGQAILIDCVCMNMNHEYFGIFKNVTFLTVSLKVIENLLGKKQPGRFCNNQTNIESWDLKRS